MLLFFLSQIFQKSCDDDAQDDHDGECRTDGQRLQQGQSAFVEKQRDGQENEHKTPEDPQLFAGLFAIFWIFQ